MDHSQPANHKQLAASSQPNMQKHLGRHVAVAIGLAGVLSLAPLSAASAAPRGGHFGVAHFGGFRAGRPFGGHRFSLGHVGHGFAGHALTHRGATRLADFHSLRDADPHALDRNAFGDARGWSRWARGNWGAGWNDWGSGFGYWAGPVFWPYLYGGALSFALWPWLPYDPFFAYGPDFLLAGLFWPGPYAWSYGDWYEIYGAPPAAMNYVAYYHHRHRRRHHRHYRHRETQTAPVKDEAGSCGGLAPDVSELRIESIKRAIKPNDAQNGILSELQQASTKAASILQASCPKIAPLTPVGRLDAIAQRLRAMNDALNTLRPALLRLDQSLDDTQRDALAKLGSHGRHKSAALNSSPTEVLAALCKKETTSFTLLPVERIQSSIQPTGDQQKAFDALKSASATAAQNLDASCPYDMPETLTARINALAKRLEALNEAVAIIKPPLKQFYGAMSDEQKARFNVIGGPDEPTQSRD